MLVLSRKKNESIVINDVIVITVVEIRGDKVRLGIEAPREVPIHRSEVLAAIQAQLPLGTALDSVPPPNGHVISEIEIPLTECKGDAECGDAEATPNCTSR